MARNRLLQKNNDIDLTCEFNRLSHSVTKIMSSFLPPETTMKSPVHCPSQNQLKRSNLKLTFALALAFGAAAQAHAQTSLGEVQAQGQTSATKPGDSFFLKAPSGTVTSIPEKQLMNRPGFDGGSNL
jgi:hypothetical protein